MQGHCAHPQAPSRSPGLTCLQRGCNAHSAPLLTEPAGTMRPPVPSHPHGPPIILRVAWRPEAQPHPGDSWPVECQKWGYLLTGPPFPFFPFCHIFQTVCLSSSSFKKASRPTTARLASLSSALATGATQHARESFRGVSAGETKQTQQTSKTHSTQPGPEFLRIR